MDTGTLNRLLTLAVFGIAGFLLARLFRLPVPFRTRLLLAVAAIVGCFVGVETRLVSIFGVAILLNWAIASSCLGMLVGLLVRGLAANSAAKRPA
jgi:hypothetical protein